MTIQKKDFSGFFEGNSDFLDSWFGESIAISRNKEFKRIKDSEQQGLFYDELLDDGFSLKDDLKENTESDQFYNYGVR
jgi:hypothetical protein